MFARFALGFGYLIFLLAVGLIVLGIHFMSSTVPSYDGSAKVAGINSAVDIDRDEFAIPHIHAASERDAWFGLGYAEAQDRMFQMEMERRLGEGRMSEIFGPRTLALDKWARTIGFSRIADEMWRRAGSHTRDILSAFVSGINAYLRNHRRHLGFEFDALTLEPEDWRPQDCMVIGRLMSWEMNFSSLTDAAYSDFSLALDSEHMRTLFPEYPDDGATVIEGADPKNFVSNYLAIAPVKATETTHQPAVKAEPVIANPSVPVVHPTTPPIQKAAPKAVPKKPAQTKPAPQQQRPHIAPPKPHAPKPPVRIGQATMRSPAFTEIYKQAQVFDSAIGAFIGGGSNSFVVAPSRTASGGAMIENDAHLQLSSPARWYLAHLTSDDGLNVAGFLIPGMPIVLAGRTPSLAWGITAGMTDESDYFIEKLDSTGTRYILPNGRPEPFTIIHDTIRVRDSIRTNPMHAMAFDVRMTVHGAVLTGMHPDSMAHVFHNDVRAGAVPDMTIFLRGARPVSLMWNGTYALGDELAGWMALPHATTIAQARAGMSSFATPCLNLCLADAQGNIAYQFIGRLPRRSGSEERLLLPRDGSNPAEAWQGFLYSPQLPSLVDPPRGYIVSANNPATRVRSIPTSMNWEPSSRADRISELIERSTVRLDTTALEHIQTDIISPYDLRRVLSYLLALYPEANPPRITPDSSSVFRMDSMRLVWKEDSLQHHTTITDSAFKIIKQNDSLWLAARRPPEDTVKPVKTDAFTALVLEYLRNWDGGMRAEEIAPTIYSVFLNRLLYHTFHDELGSARYSEFIYLDNIPLQTLAHILPDSANIWWDDVQTPGVEHRDSILQISFRESLRILAMTFGRDIRRWQWGTLHTLIFRHPFDNGTKSDKPAGLIARLVDVDAGPMPGGPTTVLQGTYYLWQPYQMQIGPSMRMVADMKSTELLAVLPTGNAEAIFGDHYRDMLPLYQQGTLLHIPLQAQSSKWKRFELLPQ